MELEEGRHMDARPKRFPNGVRTVAETGPRARHAVHPLVRAGARSKPPGTWVWAEHPEWLLTRGRPERLLDLGNPEARGWLTDHIDDLIKNQGLDWYRQDCNIDPLEFWRGPMRWTGAG